MKNVVRVRRGVGFLASLFLLLIIISFKPALAAEYPVSPLLPTTLGGKTFWAEVTEQAGTAPFQQPGTSYSFTLTATGSTNGTFAAPASPGFNARSGTWTSGFTGNGSVQQDGNYLFIRFTGLHADGQVDVFTFYPVYSGPNQIPCMYYMGRGGDQFGNGASDYQRGNVRVTDGAVPTPIAPTISFVSGGLNYSSGSSPTLSASVSGSFPLSYQWLKGASPVPNATNSVLVLTNIQVGDAGTYTIVVTNSAGTASSNLTVTVTQSIPLTITNHPSGAVVFAGQNVFLSVGVTGTAPYNYQWRKDGVNLQNGTYTLGATNSQFGVYSFNATNAGNYDVVITNYVGAVTSSVAVLTLGTAPVIDRSPLATNLVQGQTLYLEVAATGSSLTYAWYRGTTLLTTTTNNFFTKTNAQSAEQGDYTVRVSNPAATVTSAVAHVEILYTNAPFYMATPPSITTNAGANVTFTGYFYALPAPVFYWRKNGIGIPGAIGLAPNIVSNFYYSYSFLTLTNVSAADIASYSVMASNSLGVSEIPAFNLIIPQSAAPVITYQPTNQILYTADSAALRIGFISQAATTVRWYSNGVLTAASATNYAPVLSLAGNYSFYATASNQYGISTSLTASVTIKLRPGNVDTTFAPAATFDFAINAIVPQADGKVIVGGAFTYFGTSNRNRILRLTSSGALDTTWSSASNLLNNSVFALSQQADGKLLVAGDFTLVGPNPGRRYSRLARLDSAGILDTNFQCYTTDGSLAFSNSVKAIAQRADGYFAVSGKFTNVQANLQQCVALFDSNGIFQTGFRPTFGAATPSTLSVEAIAFQSDGKLLVAGIFTNVSGSGRTHVARLTSSGGVDTTFSGLPQTSGRSLLLQADGRILVGGASASSISRLASNGAADNIGFGQAVAGGVGVYALVQQPSGQILIGGDFTSSMSTPNHGYLVRVNADGSNDAVFKSYPVGPVYALAVGPDGGLWVGGSFISISPEGVPRASLAKLLGEAPPVPAPAFGTPILVSGAMQVQFNSAHGRTYQVEYKLNLTDSSWTLYQTVPGDGTVKTISISATGARAFFRLVLLP